MITSDQRSIYERLPAWTVSIVDQAILSKQRTLIGVAAKVAELKLMTI
jgi:tellurite resistance-related uncharacterized protein